MKILLVHHRMPWPLNNGMDKLRFNLVRTLQISHEITLVAPFKGSKNDTLNELKEYVKDLIIFQENDAQKNRLSFNLIRLFYLIFFKRPYYVSDYYSKKFDYFLKDLIKNSDFEYIHFLSDFSGQYLLSNTDKCKVILGPIDDNVTTYFENYTAASKFPKRLLSYLNYLAVKFFFKRIISNAKIVYFHSQEDMERVCKRLRKKVNAEILPVATEIESELHKEEYVIESKSIVFVGGLGSSFNQDAVIYFCKNIFPIILSEIPEIKFYIVGTSPNEEILKFNNGTSVIVTGAVDNVELYINRASVYVSPIRKGTGIKTKMVEAFKAGKAIVATGKALQGLWEIDNDAIRIENNSLDFAKAVIEILNNNELRMRMEERTRQLYENFYIFPKVAPITLKIYSENLS